MAAKRSSPAQLVMERAGGCVNAPPGFSPAPKAPLEPDSQRRGSLRNTRSLVFPAGPVASLWFQISLSIRQWRAGVHPISLFSSTARQLRVHFELSHESRHL